MKGKLDIAFEHDEVAGTNIEAVFDLILITAIDNQLKQEELPETVLVLSDMEFNDASGHRANDKLFDVIRRKFEAFEYKPPKLAFWNINSGTMAIPVRENELGVALISGFSPSVVQMVMSGELDPVKAMTSVLSDVRYDLVREALKVGESA